MGWGNENRVYTKAGSARLDSGTHEHVRMTVTERIYFDRLTTRTRNAIRKALQTGILGSVSGTAAYFFRLLANEVNLPYITAQQKGDYKYMSFTEQWPTHIKDQLAAMSKLSGANVSTNQYNYGYICYNYCRALHPDAVAPVIEKFYSNFSERAERAIAILDNGGYIETTTTLGDH